MPVLSEPNRAVLEPRLAQAESTRLFRRFARELATVAGGTTERTAIDELLASFSDQATDAAPEDRQALLAAAHVLADLVVQGWSLDVRPRAIAVAPPEAVTGDVAAEKARIRRQELVKRDAQLAEPSVQRFIDAMERPRIVAGRPVSIFALMRDGRDLAARLRAARESPDRDASLRGAIDPFLEFVTDRAVCPHTKLSLMDVWRYFRHTWSNQYTSVPGRGMLFLVRDRAAPFHPVIGIGALASPIMQIRERDESIGWHPDTFIASVRETLDPATISWARAIVDAAVDETYVDDLIEDGVVSAREINQPTDACLERLDEHGREQRERHHRFVQSKDHKPASPSQDDDRWLVRARTHLFRSKRALALAEYLRCRRELARLGATPAAEDLRRFIESPTGVAVLRRVLRKAKADRVGIALADISVCGAVQPYNAVLGGKLVSMVAASPEVVAAYRRKYEAAESEIASSMAGRSIVRPAQLVFLGTTSLYGIGSSQYNRVVIPCDRVGGRSGEAIRYAELGKSEAFGTSQYSEDTVEALADLVQQSRNGQRVNNIFGEGISPKLRKVRHGLDLLGFPSELLLRHHRQRVLYGVSLIRNLRTYLLGIDADPDYLIDPSRGADGTARIAEWWRQRWLVQRIQSDEVLDAVAKHTLVRPVRHGARVPIERDARQRALFDE